MNASNSVQNRDLERQGKRMIAPAMRFIAIGALLAAAGIALILIGRGWSIGVGIALILLGSVPATIGFGLLTGGAIARWAARHKLFA
jgi:hypothetical protein